MKPHYLIVAVAACIGPMQENTMTDQLKNKELVRRSIYVVWGERKLDAVGEFVAPEFIDHGNPSGPVGATGFANGVRRVISAFPDATNHIDDIVAEGDRVVVRWTMSGTNSGDGLGFPATNRKVTFSGVTIARMSHGRIAEHWSFRDDLGLLRQLGFMP